MADFAIGDIHGQVRQLNDLLHGLPLERHDRLIFLGDYIDRGENTMAVLDLLVEIQDRHPQSVFLRGNHEQMMLDSLAEPSPVYKRDRKALRAGPETIRWIQNGGDETLRSYGMENAKDVIRWWNRVPKEHWTFLKSLPTEYVSFNHHFVHAGINPTGETTDEHRLWGHEDFLESRIIHGGRRVVFGHHSHKRPLIMPNKIGIDTGCGKGGLLTAVRLDGDDVRFYSA